MACIIPQSSESTSRFSSNYEVGATPNSHTVSRFQKIFGQDSRTHDGPPTKHIGSSSPSSSPTITNDFLADDTNAFTTLPTVVKHLTHVVRRAKEKHKPYNRKRARTIELRFAERYIGLTGMSPVDAQRGKVLAKRGLKHMSCEAIAQAVLTKEADLECKRLCALASAWEIEALRRHKRLARIIHDDKAKVYASANSEPFLHSLEKIVDSDLDLEELQSRMTFAIAAYSQDRSFYSAADAQLDHLEDIALEHYNEDEDYLPASLTESDASTSSSGEDDAGVVRRISEISTKSDD